MDLTNDAKKVLYELYKEYSARRKRNEPRRKAAHFQSASFIHSEFFRDWLLEDVEDCLRELGRNGFLNNQYADNTIHNCFLSDHAITVMEAQKKEVLSNVVDFVAKFIPILSV